MFFETDRSEKDKKDEEDSAYLLSPFNNIVVKFPPLIPRNGKRLLF
jgi:hypothetical protein